jgi:hypothetical protein
MMPSVRWENEATVVIIELGIRVVQAIARRIVNSSLCRRDFADEQK